ncbi:MAG TPA: DMT family transporter [Candidatus Sulfomarinibacteraceae bacterium]|nr:DMT family transporter [Candidatus Sulfomarinibacteraceae bacterium]
MTARAARLDWILFAALGLIWGSSYLFIKIGVETLPTFTLVAARLGIGLALLAIVVAIAREPLPRDPKIYGHLVVMSVVNIAVPFALITSAEQTVDSAVAAILNGGVPLFTIVIAALVLHDEPITVNRIAGLVIGYAGVVLLVGRGLGSGGGDGAISGELALLASTASYGFGNVYARRNVRGLRPMIPALFQVLFGFVITGTIAILTERPFDVAWTDRSIVAIVWLGLLGSGIAYLVYFRLLQAWGATRTSMVAYTLPIVGIAAGALVLGEVVDGGMLVGTAFVIGGVALVNSRFGQRRIFGRTPPVAGA